MSGRSNQRKAKHPLMNNTEYAEANRPYQVMPALSDDEYQRVTHNN